ncbi:hypothetical protein ABTQ33_02220 [Paucilactobacillus suebicus]|uniref:hypothetical protein n=1 Tax=Paucilactobacillus suebicus TaxID=152335 RepID=UPI000496A2A1|nr:hypothetical protein [Paucilactobacillus suebicus]
MFRLIVMIFILATGLFQLNRDRHQSSKSSRIRMISVSLFMLSAVTMMYDNLYVSLIGLAMVIIADVIAVMNMKQNRVQK